MMHDQQADKDKRISFPSNELNLLWRIPFSTETDPDKVDNALHERIKELNCLYGISQLAERHLYSIENFLSALVNFLPYSWQYPDVTCCRIFYNGETYTSDRFEITPWRQSSLVYMYHKTIGECSIFYLEECPPADEGPFLNEERALLDAVAEQIGTIATRMTVDMELQETNRQLTLERQALKETNTALRLIMERIEQEKQEIYQDIKTNFDKVLMPVIEALSLQLPESKKAFIDILRANLNDITSPFIGKLTTTNQSLTPTEISICNMIRNGLRTKEIAEIRNVSESTVNRHREKIRRKLDMVNKNINLSSFLQSGNWQQKPKE